MTRNKALVVCALALLLGVTAVRAAEFDDGQSVNYYNTLKGKKVIFIPISAGFDIVEAFLAAMHKQADRFGYDLSVRDPNWNNDAGLQAISAAIEEKPDLLVVQNLDLQAYARMLKKAVQSGIPLLQVQVKSAANTGAYVGADWYQVAYRTTEILVKACQPSAGKTGQIAIMQGTPTNPTNALGMAAAEDILKEHPEIKVVSQQAGDWDATKAHAVASTVLKQNPDLCGYLGLWDGQDVGVAAAIADAGKTGKVFLATSGAGEKSACDNVSNGRYDAYVSYDSAAQARDINDAIQVMLQQKLKPGTENFAIYSPTKDITKANVGPDSCWTLEGIKRGNP